MPYLLVLPALLLELLIHLVPMVVGIVMSFKELTQFYIRDWSQAPWTGLGNYRVAVDFHAADRRGAAALVLAHLRLHRARRSACPGCSAPPRRS